MSIELLGLLEHGERAVTILLGVVLVVLIPRAMELAREVTKTFSEQLEAERGAHRSETQAHAHSLDRLADSSHEMTLELRSQTEVLRSQTELMRSMTPAQAHTGNNGITESGR